MSDQDLQNQPGDNQIPDGEAGDLIFGKYKTMEEAEKGIATLNKFATQKSQESADYKRKLDDIQSQMQRVKEADTAKEKEKAIKELQNKQYNLNAYLQDNLKKNPAEAISTVMRESGFVTRPDLANMFNAMGKVGAITKKVMTIRSTDPEAFDALAPQMQKEIALLPQDLRDKPEVLELIFDKAKGNLTPDELREKVVNAQRAATNIQSTTPPPRDRRDKNDKYIETIIGAHKANKVL